MVLFDDFNIEAGCSEFGSCLGQNGLDQIDAERHIGALEDRDLFRGLFHGSCLFLGKTCGADYDRDRTSCAVGKQTFHGCSCRKVNDDICLFLTLIERCIHGEIRIGASESVDSGSDLNAGISGNDVRDHMSHTPAGAVKYCFYHLCLLLTCESLS